MKKKLAIMAASVVVLSVAGYLIPIAVSVATAKPLYGNFYTESVCAGGHEIFLFLDEHEAYESCPGHRHLIKDDRIKIERSENSVFDLPNQRRYTVLSNRVRWNTSCGRVL